jgi:hypothetical protein
MILCRIYAVNYGVYQVLGQHQRIQHLKAALVVKESNAFKAFAQALHLMYRVVQ